MPDTLIMQLAPNLTGCFLCVWPPRDCQFLPICIPAMRNDQKGIKQRSSAGPVALI